MRRPFLTSVGCVFILVVAFASGLWIAPVQRDAPSQMADNGAPPDPDVFAAALSGLQQYGRARQAANPGWAVAVNRRTGVIETAWFAEHKGEVWLKVQITVWGRFFRVDVYQRLGLIVPYASRGTHWSTLWERGLHEHISAILAEPARR